MNSLSDFVGNKAAVKHTAALIDSGDLPKTVLYYGPSGCGKTSLARILARSFAEEFNIVEHNSAFLSGVESARSVAAIADTPPIIGGFRIFILDEVHRGSRQFFDVLLKPLEEAKHTRFILCTTEESFLKKYPTVTTRAVKIKVKPLNLDETRQLVAKKLGKKLASNKNLISLIWQLSGGVPREILNCCGVISRASSLDDALYNLQEHYSIRGGGNLTKFSYVLFSATSTDEEFEKYFYSISDKLQSNPEEIRLFLVSRLERAIRTQEIPISNLTTKRAINVLYALQNSWYSYLDAVRGIIEIRKALTEIYE